MEIQKNKFNRIVIWGLKKRYHTHRHIHQAFYKNAKKLGYNTVWLEDEKKNAQFIEPNDLIISVDAAGKMVKEKLAIEDYHMPIRDDIFYCLHNFKVFFTDKIKTQNLLKLQIYTNLAESADQKWGPLTYFDTKTRTLYQPWGTDLLPEEFKKPIFNKNTFVFWVGSIWNDKNNNGNIIEVTELKSILKKYGLRFIHVRFVPDFINTLLIRLSRIAPAIAGRWQVSVNYPPCRMFKNISYGQLGFSNVEKFNDILGKYNIYSNNMEEMVNKVLALNEEEYKNIVEKQQEIVKNYTYKNALENIFKAFNEYE